MDFNTFLTKVHQSQPPKSGKFIGRVLALDPGETTGWSIWDSHDQGTKYVMEASGQLETWDKQEHNIKPCVYNFKDLLRECQPDHVVMERYAVYEWKTDSHAWSDVPTLRIIGSMETRLIDNNISYHMQTAQAAKNFVTDDKLREWDFWKKGERHARDSMRHALFFLLFGLQGK